MGKQILILDDDQNILDMASFLLTDSGYEVQPLNTGEEVFAVISQFNPHLVLMDVMLAQLDGRVICSKMKAKEQTLHISVILISGTHDLTSTLDQIGAPNDFMAKPFDIEVLLENIKAQLAPPSIQPGV